jgi:hypothetical protein
VGELRCCGRPWRVALAAAITGSVNLLIDSSPLRGILKQRQSEAQIDTESSCIVMASF